MAKARSNRGRAPARSPWPRRTSARLLRLPAVVKVASVAVSILDGQLGLADAAQAPQGLRPPSWSLYRPAWTDVADQRGWLATGRLVEPVQQAPLTRGVLCEDGPPLRLAELGDEVVVRQDGHDLGRPVDLSMHTRHEGIPGPEVPDIQHNGVPSVLQLPSDPLRPGPVIPGVADEEVAGRVSHQPLRKSMGRLRLLTDRVCPIRTVSVEEPGQVTLAARLRVEELPLPFALNGLRGRPTKASTDL
jgi:hypothetical protein